jgi:ATP-binding cassette subfamily F protein uup
VLAALERVHAELGAASGAELERLLARQAALEQELERTGGHDVEHRVEATMRSLGLTDLDAPCGRLSGGERRRVALARLLIGAPDLLLLDEPTNHLDALVTDWLEDWFLETRTPLLMVTHDRYFLDRVVDRIVELDRGQLVPYEGGYAEYLEARAERLATERRTEGARLLLLRRETAWMRRGAPARTTKAKARIHRYHDLIDAAPVELPSELVLAIPPGPRLGTRVLAVQGLTKRYGARTVVPPLDLELAAGTRLGIVGPNGAGKSTLLGMLIGTIEPDGGTRSVGETVRFMGIDQERSDLDPANTVVEEVAGRGDVVRSGERTVRVEGFLDRFGFPVASQSMPIARLSGGERNRVCLAKLFCAGGNVLALDEPTNDLDLPTLRELEEALIAFPGVCLIVSHDRWFLDRVATRILYLDGQGGWRLHYGDLSGLLGELARERAELEGAARVAAPRSPLSAGPAASTARKRRIAPWEQKELDGIEHEMAAVEAAAAQLAARLADPLIYSGPRAALDTVRTHRPAARARLAELMTRWEELESLR